MLKGENVEPHIEDGGFLLSSILRKILVSLHNRHNNAHFTNPKVKCEGVNVPRPLEAGEFTGDGSENMHTIIEAHCCCCVFWK